MTGGGVRLFYKKDRTWACHLDSKWLYLFDDFRHLTDHRALIVYDVRNRGHSDGVADGKKLERGILNDVDDSDAVRRHFDLNEIDLLGHSCMALMIVLYALKMGDMLAA
jgi:pimeloyl-ACP methyl ester carboxylesterase